MQYVVALSEVNNNDVEIVGGKNASLGEMIGNLKSKGILVPEGFATLASAYQTFIDENNLEESILNLLNKVDYQNLKLLNRISAQIRQLILKAKFNNAFIEEITQCVTVMPNASFAIRSSATAEDLPEASFAGQQETFLNVKGIKNILTAIKAVYASIFTSRSIAYRQHHKFDHSHFKISATIQPMVRSDKGVSGIMFTLDTESGFDKVILINASYGLGEALVQGKVTPDEFCVYKPGLETNRFAILQRKLGDKSVKMIYGKTQDSHSQIKTVSVDENEKNKFCLTDDEIHQLARYALIIEKHYQKPMDIEWAKDGVDGKLYIVQARPETVKSRQEGNVIEQYILNNKSSVITEGLSIGQKIGSGIAKIILDPSRIDEINEGDVLVTEITDPDWEPIMKKASAIITNRGSRTCHAAIVARELGIPAVVGTGNATQIIKNNAPVTVSCADGEIGYVYEGILPFDVKKIAVHAMPRSSVKMCMNLGQPDKAFSSQFLPNEGVGLARLEFIISQIGVHPNAILNYATLPNKLQSLINKKTQCFDTPKDYYIEKLREGIAKIAAAFFPKPVIFRFSDFKSNEYANLLGGSLFEETEENPMIGFRGASRYRHEKFRACFEMECDAIKLVRNQMGLTNAFVMLPFVRTVDELKSTLDLMQMFGLSRSEDFKIFMMCEIPSNVILAEQFLEFVDGYSIGSNDLTQLILGLDRDSTIVSSMFDERNEAVKDFLAKAIVACKKLNKYIGICGQGPSDHPELAIWLAKQGIDSMSLNPDTIIPTWIKLANSERDEVDTILFDSGDDLATI